MIRNGALCDVHRTVETGCNELSPQVVLTCALWVFAALSESLFAQPVRVTGIIEDSRVFNGEEEILLTNLTIESSARVSFSGAIIYVGRGVVCKGRVEAQDSELLGQVSSFTPATIAFNDGGLGEFSNCRFEDMSLSGGTGSNVVVRDSVFGWKQAVGTLNVGGGAEMEVLSSELGLTMISAQNEGKLRLRDCTASEVLPTLRIGEASHVEATGCVFSDVHLLGGSFDIKGNVFVSEIPVRVADWEYSLQDLSDNEFADGDTMIAVIGHVKSDLRFAAVGSIDCYWIAGVGRDPIAVEEGISLSIDEGIRVRVERLIVKGAIKTVGVEFVGGLRTHSGTIAFNDGGLGEFSNCRFEDMSLSGGAGSNVVVRDSVFGWKQAVGTLNVGGGAEMEVLSCELGLTMISAQNEGKLRLRDCTASEVLPTLRIGEASHVEATGCVFSDVHLLGGSFDIKGNVFVSEIPVRVADWEYSLQDLSDNEFADGDTMIAVIGHVKSDLRFAAVGSIDSYWIAGVGRDPIAVEEGISLSIDEGIRVRVERLIVKGAIKTVGVEFVGGLRTHSGTIAFNDGGLGEFSNCRFEDMSLSGGTGSNVVVRDSVFGWKQAVGTLNVGGGAEMEVLSSELGLTMISAQNEGKLRLRDCTASEVLPTLRIGEASHVEATGCVFSDVHLLGGSFDIKGNVFVSEIPVRVADWEYSLQDLSDNEFADDDAVIGLEGNINRDLYLAPVGAIDTFWFVGVGRNPIVVGEGASLGFEPGVSVRLSPIHVHGDLDAQNVHFIGAWRNNSAVNVGFYGRSTGSFEDCTFEQAGVWVSESSSVEMVRCWLKPGQSRSNPGSSGLGRLVFDRCRLNVSRLASREGSRVSIVNSFFDGDITLTDNAVGTVERSLIRGGVSVAREVNFSSFGNDFANAVFRIENEGSISGLARNYWGTVDLSRYPNKELS